VAWKVAAAAQAASAAAVGSVPGDLARIDLAVPQPHQHAALAQLGEEPGPTPVANGFTVELTRPLLGLNAGDYFSVTPLHRHERQVDTDY
jgi:hypothetical protein